MFGFRALYLLTKASDMADDTRTETTVIAGNCLQCLLPQLENETVYELRIADGAGLWRGSRTGDQAVFHDTKPDGVQLTITLTANEAHRRMAALTAHPQTPTPLSVDDAMATVERLLARARQGLD